MTTDLKIARYFVNFDSDIQNNHTKIETPMHVKNSKQTKSRQNDFNGFPVTESLQGLGRAVASNVSIQ